MTPDQRNATAIELMDDFATRTGLVGDAVQQRYLWTDAFAACNFLGLAEATGEPRFRELAFATVDAVHEVLAQHRSDSGAQGWLDDASEQHPTRGGLRIGKPLPERDRDEPVDERLEWERDGQYFHYLTRWMHALDQLARGTGEARFNLWARELAQAAFDGFVHTGSDGRPRMYWKMSIGLSRPLVRSMGHHDPLDGYITVLELRHTAAAAGETGGPGLREAEDAFAGMIEGGGFATTDPLGLGGLMMDAFRVEQLMRRNGGGNGRLLVALLEAAHTGLRHYRPEDEAPAEYRLGFRELGLAIGLAALERMGAAAVDGRFGGGDAAARRLEPLQPFLPMRATIEGFWLRPANRKAPSWTGHRDINEVMLATSLVPDGYLRLPALR